MAQEISKTCIVALRNYLSAAFPVGGERTVITIFVSQSVTILTNLGRLHCAE